MTDAHHRFSYAEDDALMRAYHDEEWGCPGMNPGCFGKC